MNPNHYPFIWRRLAVQALILAGLVLGVLLWRLRPEQSLTWLTGMLTLPLCWGLLRVLGALGENQSVFSRQQLYNALVVAGLMVVGALLAVTMTTLEWMPENWSDRYGMLISALVLVVIGNGLPKTIEPGCSRSRGQALQRLFGWTFVVGGLLLAALWLSPLSMHIARPLSMLLYGLMLASCVIGYLRIRASDRNA